MSAGPILTAVLACHNRKEKTLDCLASLFACVHGLELRVILFDDASSDGTAAAVRARHPAVTILNGDGQAYWAGGMRVAFATAIAEKPDYILWLNDDVRLEPDAIARLLAAVEEAQHAGRQATVVGGAVADARTGLTTYGGIRRFDPRWPLRFRRIQPHATQSVLCDTLVGNVILVPRQTVERVGGIDPAFRHTLADLDYGLRVVQAGGRCVLAPGHVGWCAPNERVERWFNPDLPLSARWRLLNHPLGFPIGPWLHFARRHGGSLWGLFALMPFWRLLVPVWVARAVDRRRAVPASSRPRHA